MGNFYNELAEVFARCAGNDCMRLPSGEVWTYQRLADTVTRLSGVLVEAGVGRGDRVVVQVEKSPMNLALYLATLRMGGVYVPLNTAYTDAELDYFISDAEPALFVGRAPREGVPSLELDAEGNGTLSAQLADYKGTIPDVSPVEDNDLGAILYTSGTTGRSKGAMLSHANLATNAHALCEAWDWREDDVLLHALPIFHVHGLFVASHCALLYGSAMEFLPKFAPGPVEDALGRVTVMMGVPTFYTRLLSQSEFPTASLAHIRLFICGSAPLTEQVFLEWEARTGHRIVERYGMSETVINTTNPVDGDRVPGTVGFALPGLELRIVNETGEPLPVGAVGSIEVRGPSVFSGYWRMPEKTAEEFRSDGFFITGDLGTVDAQGRVSIVGRSKDLVISGGYNVYPKEVERLIDDIPGVSECAVIGVPHADFGEGVVAIVVPEGEPVSLARVEQALDGELARFKQPKHVINVQELPRNTMGKVQKNVLRDTYADLFES